MTHPSSISLVKTIDQLYNINGSASSAVSSKKLKKLEKHSIDFIARSPFLVLATNNEQEGGDASPRGDEPGFVKVLDETTLLIPERPGNRLADSMHNLIDNPSVGIIFIIPGMNETIRVNGDAYITDEKDYLDMLKHKGVAPKLAIVVDVKQVYLHCAKAFIRSKLWQSSEYMERSELPTAGKILLDQIKGEGITDQQVAAIDGVIDSDAVVNLYHS